MPIRFESYRKQKRCEGADHFGVTADAKKGLFSCVAGSDSDFATNYVGHNITRRRPGSCPVSPETSVAALQQAPRPSFRLNSCRGSNLVRASGFDASPQDFYETVQVVLRNLAYNFRRLRKCKTLCAKALVLQKLRAPLSLSRTSCGQLGM